MDLKTSISASEFWQYSLQYYTQNNNQETLLWLQDNAALNVNIVLLIMYLQTKSVFISTKQFNQLNNINQKLDSLTSNFREKRRLLKADNIGKGMADYRTDDYKDLLHQELESERQQQARLIDTVFDFAKDNHEIKNHSDIASMDIRYYLLPLLTGIDNDLVADSDSLINVLINEQQKLASSFGQHQNE